LIVNRVKMPEVIETATASFVAIWSEKYAMLERQLRQNPFKRPLVIE
jgi:hypothetical protein